MSQEEEYEVKDEELKEEIDKARRETVTKGPREWRGPFVGEYFYVLK